MSQFQTRRMLEDRWENPRGLTRFLNSYGYRISYNTVYQWFSRDRVPAEWCYLLLALHEVETGYPASLVRYVTQH